MASASPFASTPLDPAVREIRLVELLPGTGHEAIQCRLRRFPLSELPPYVALSYTWGRQEAYRNILLEEKSLPLCRNLWTFLHQARPSKHASFLWVDALCIDQANPSERTHQIQLMRQIYSNATSVSIWLGEANPFDESDLAMDYISRNGPKPLRSQGYGFRPIWTARQGRALLALFQRNFWRRTWVVQELLHAKELTVYCGSKQFRWQDVESTFQKLKTISESGRINHVFYAAAVLESPASVLIGARSTWDKQQIPLQTLLELCSGLQSTDVRDRVFGLLGLASNASLVTVDYSISPRMILFKTLKNISTLYHPTEWEGMMEFGKALRDALRVQFPDEQLRSEVLSLVFDAWDPPSSQEPSETSQSNHPSGGAFCDALMDTDRLLLDPKRLARLSAHFDRLMCSIQQRWEALSVEVNLTPPIPDERTEEAIELVDAQIHRFRELLRQIDELQAEFDKIRLIGEIVKGFRARVEALNRHV